MQYILSEEELGKLVPMEKYQLAMRANELARELILKATDTVCIHDHSVPTRQNKLCGYCSGCPLGELTGGERYAPLKALCGQTRNYPK
jgi:hypothetical protein